MPLRSIETKEQRQQRFLQEKLARQATEQEIKQGLSSLPGQAAWMGGLMLPTSGITDYSGLYPEAPTGKGMTGETMPSFGENIQNKEYLSALYQLLGLGGDLALGAGAFYPPLLPLAAGMKVISGVGKAAKTAEQANMAARILPRYMVRENGVVTNPDILRIKLPKSYNPLWKIQAKYVETTDGKFMVAPSLGSPTGGVGSQLHESSLVYNSLDQAKTGLIDYALGSAELKVGTAGSKTQEKMISRIRKKLETERYTPAQPNETGILDERFNFIPFTEALLETEMSIKGFLPKLPRKEVDRIYEEEAAQDPRLLEGLYEAAARRQNKTVSEIVAETQAGFEVPTGGSEEIIKTDFGGGVTMRASRDETEKFLAREDSPEEQRLMDEAFERYETKKEQESLDLIREEVATATKAEATADELLDWQKPLTEQQPAVQEKIKNLIGEDFFNQAVGDGYTGEEFYDRFNDAILRGDLELGEPLLSKKKFGAGAFLNDAGIKGIAYGPGSVKVFDPKKTKTPKTAKLPKSLQTQKNPAALTNKRISAHTLVRGGFDPSEKFQEELWSAFPEPYIQKKYDQYGDFKMHESVPRWARSKQSKHGEFTGMRDIHDLTESWSEVGAGDFEHFYTRDSSGNLIGDPDEVTRNLLLKDELIPEQADELLKWNKTVEEQERTIDLLESGGYTPEGMTDEEVDIALRKIFADQETVEVEVFDFSDDDIPPFNSGGPVTKPLYANRRYI